MNFTMWVLAGGAIGWAGFAFLRFNENRGMIVSVIMGVIGGFIGGKMLSPMLGVATAVPGDFSIQALFVAAMGAAACLAVGNLVENRFGV